MVKERGKDPSPTTVSRTLHLLFNKTTAGAIGAGLAVRYGPELVHSLCPVDIPHWQAVIGCSVVGTSVGVTTFGALQTSRRIAIKKLLTYRRWITDQKSLKTKVWALLLKALVGPQPHVLFDFENLLPKLPLPEVEDTCRRYLASLEPLLSEEDYATTKQLVENFKQNEAPALQKYLKNRHRKLQSWLADWWVLSAYLARRESIAINVNFYMMSSVMPEVSNNHFARAANCIVALIKYYEMIQSRTLPPDMILNMVPLCMDSVRYMFASCRIPGEHVDSLVTTENSKHIVVIRRGVYYKMDVYAPDSRGKPRRLTKRELVKQLQFITDDTRDVREINKIAALTTQNRTKWAKHRQMLMRSSTNRASLKEIEEAIIMNVLSDEEAKDDSHQARLSLAGTGADRWFDKGMTTDMFGKTTMGGCNMEHTGADATHFSVMFEHVLLQEEYGPDGDLVDVPGEVCRDLRPPQRLKWEIDNEMKTIIDAAHDEYLQTIDNLDVYVMPTEFGRKWMKSTKISPDGFLQMAIQLAYWRLHARVTKTYEPASHRLFALGRTDNINPVSPASRRFTHVMDDPTASTDQKIDCLREAIRYQSRVRLECTAGDGFERHLLGLECAARELGMDTPSLFSDKAYNLPTYLSTSQVPSNIGALGLSIVPESIVGGFGPVHADGYGLLYNTVGDNMFNFSITSWKSSSMTDSRRLGAAIQQAMSDMRDLLNRKAPK